MGWRPTPWVEEVLLLFVGKYDEVFEGSELDGKDSSLGGSSLTGEGSSSVMGIEEGRRRSRSGLERDMVDECRRRWEEK